MSSLGQNITYLSTNTPLTSGSSWNSDGVFLSDYATLNILAYTDQSATLSVQYSGDGQNFDLVNTYYISANTPFQLSLTVITQWIKFVLTNIGSNETVLRFFTYGSDISGNEGSGSTGSSGSSSNTLFGDSSVETFKIGSGCQFNFSTLQNQSVSTFGGSSPLIDANVLTWESSNGNNYNYSVANNMLYLNSIGTGATGGYARFYGTSLLPYKAGTDVRARFSFLVYDTNPSAPDAEYICGYGTEKLGNNSWLNGASIGSSSSSASSGGYYYKWVCRYYNDAGSVMFRQNVWNVDRLDGLGPSKFTLNFGVVNTFQILLSGSGDIIWQIYNPKTSSWITFNIAYSGGALPLLNNGAGNFIFQITSDVAVPAKSQYAAVSEFCAEISNNSIPKSLPVCRSYWNGITGVTNVPVLALTMTNPSIYLGNYNWMGVQIQSFTIMVVSSSVGIIAQLLKNPVWNSDAPTTSYLDQYTLPIQTGTGIQGYTGGNVVATCIAAPSSSITISPVNAILNPRDYYILVLTANSAGTVSVQYSLQFNVCE